MENIFKPFDPVANQQLRKLYIDDLSAQRKGDDGRTYQRGRHIHLWEAIPEVNNPLDITSSGKNIWVWSDLHFGHNNIIRFSDRPYPDVFEMNEQLINSFNNTVTSINDISIWVGDVSFWSSAETKAMVRRMLGYKILIAGNHDFDRKKGLKEMAFDEVHLVYNLQYGATKLAFTHYPLTDVPVGWYNVHGHIHRSGNHPGEGETPLHFNVNCEFLDYKPINLNDIVRRIK